MRIRPYIPDLDFDEIKNWITDERTHAMWCANLTPYPLRKKEFEEMLEEFSMKYKYSPYVAATEEGKLIGFFCYSMNSDTKGGMLRFIMVAPTYRHKGYGREMLTLAVKHGFEITKADAIQLNVFSENTAAKKCYASVGFIERTNTEKAFSFNNEVWGRCNMVIKNCVP